MEPMQDQNCSNEFQEIYNDNRSPQDSKFDQIISQLQEIVISGQFQKVLSNFMKNNWNVLESNNKNKQIQVFQNYKKQIQSYLQINITKKINSFNWMQFITLFQSRSIFVDQQILDTIQSFEDLQHFKLFINDYRNSYEEQQMLKVLTIKSNKISQNKKIKGKDNIFANNAFQVNNIFGDQSLKPINKKSQKKQKTQQELLVPQLILTVRPMRKN